MEYVYWTSHAWQNQVWDGNQWRWEWQPGYKWDVGSFFQFGLNTGYKFVTRSGVFFNVGTFIGGAVGADFLFIFNPDISFGWTMR